MRTVVDDIKSILSVQAYERGHAYCRAEVDSIYSELCHDFKDVIARIAELEAENQRLQNGIQNLLRFTPYTKEQVVGAIAALLGGSDE